MIMVTGAQGNLGSLVLRELRMRDIAAIGGSRNPGADQLYLDFDLPDTLDFTGISTLVLISAGYAEDDRVIHRHQSVVSAAARDQVTHVIYTSLSQHGDHLGFALAHRVTEQIIMDSGLDWTVLRNGLYAELFGSLFAWDGNIIESAFGNGKLSAAARTDLAAVVALVASQRQEHCGKTYELTGPPISADDVAHELGVTHRDLELAESRRRFLADPALSPFQPPMLNSIASSVKFGLLHRENSDLDNLLDRPGANTLRVAAQYALLKKHDNA